jgi:hypothetical protein
MAKIVLFMAGLVLAGSFLAREAAASRPGMFLYPLKNGLNDLVALFSNTTVIWVPVSVPHDPSPQSSISPTANSVQPATGSTRQDASVRPLNATVTRSAQPAAELDPVVGRDVDTLYGEFSPTPSTGQFASGEAVSVTPIVEAEDAGKGDKQLTDFSPSILVPGDLTRVDLSAGSQKGDGQNSRDSDDGEDHDRDDDGSED